MPTNAEGTHRGTLSVNLIDVCQPSGEGIGCDLVSKLVAEIRSLLTGAANLSAGISCISKMQLNLLKQEDTG